MGVYFSFAFELFFAICILRFVWHICIVYRNVIASQSRGQHPSLDAWIVQSFGQRQSSEVVQVARRLGRLISYS